MKQVAKDNVLNNNISVNRRRYKNFSAELKPSKKALSFAKAADIVSNKEIKSDISATNAYLDSNVYVANSNNAGKLVAGIKQRQIDSYDELENYKRLVKKRKKRLIARIATILLLLIVAPAMIFFGTIIIDKNSRHDFFGLNFYIVISESMEPEIMVNDCVVLNKVTDVHTLKVGDDIGYINDKGAVVVHRIESIIKTASGALEFETGGINNLSSDQKRVSFEQIVGKRIATFSALGNAVVFFRSVPGIILFFTVFAGVMAGFYVAFRMSENIKYVESVK